MTTTQKYLAWIGGGVAVVALVVGTVLVLRSRNAPVEDVVNAPRVSTTSSGAVRNTSGSDLTADDLKKREASAKLQQTLPASVKDTWTPEFKAQMEAQDAQRAKNRVQ